MRLLATLVLVAGYAHNPFDSRLGCNEVAAPEAPAGWKVLECAHTFVSRAPDNGPRGACGPAGRTSSLNLECGWTDAVTDCAAREIRIWEHARAGAYAHELTHARACK